MNLQETEPKPRVLFFVIDTASSMTGSKIEAVNNAIKEVIPEICKRSNENYIENINIAIIEYSSGEKWITKHPIEIEYFGWNDLKAKDNADFGAACKALNEKLSANAFMQKSRSPSPIIILMSNGNPTDDWEKPLAELKNNICFKKAIKAAIAIGNDSNIDLLSEFTGSKETVIEVQPDIINKLLYEVLYSIEKWYSSPVSKDSEKEINFIQNSFIFGIKNNLKANQESDKNKNDYSEEITQKTDEDDDWL